MGVYSDALRVLLSSTWDPPGTVAAPITAAHLAQGLINTYSLGWLRQESNHYLELPSSTAMQFTPRQRALLGYTAHGCGDDSIGKYDGNDCPAWLDTPPEPAWREERGQVGTAEKCASSGRRLAVAALGGDK